MTLTNFKAILLPLVIMLVSATSLAQNLASDSLLRKVEHELPDNWIFQITDSTLVISCNDSVWVAYGNWINAPTKVWDLKNDSTWIMKTGTQRELKFKFLLSGKLSSLEINKLKETDVSYKGRYAIRFYNSEKYTLRLVHSPTNNDEYHAVWPRNLNTYEIDKLLEKHLKIPK